MKSKLSLLLIILISIVSFGQVKKEFFYDYDLNEISKEKFTVLKNKENYALQYEFETSLKTFLVEIKTSGKFNYYHLETIKKNLVSLASETSLEDFNYIVINYINNDVNLKNKNHQVPWDIFENDISKSLKKADKVKHYFIINPDVKNIYYYHGDTINWKIDKDHFLQKNFFLFNELNGGFLIIDKEGNYILYKGEYSRKDVLDQLNLMKKK